MRRSIGLLLIANAAVLVRSQELASIAASPYALARYVETHHDFDWQPLWQALGIKDQEAFLPPCEENFSGVAPCSSELITVLDPLQMIVLLEHRASGFQVYVRYESAGTGRWRIAGAYSPFVKYFEPEHHMIRFGTKPFLIVTGQGYAGTGISSKIESWIDLSGKGMEPVLSFTSEGYDFPAPDGIAREVHGFVTALATEPVEQVTVSVSIEFHELQNGDPRIALGRRSDTIVYRRSRTKFKLVAEHSTATAQEIEKFYDLGSEVTSAEFLRFHREGLIALAKGEDEEARSWLARFLNRCPDAPEVRELKLLLAPER